MLYFFFGQLSVAIVCGTSMSIVYDSDELIIRLIILGATLYQAGATQCIYDYRDGIIRRTILNGLLRKRKSYFIGFACALVWAAATLSIWLVFSPIESKSVFFICVILNYACVVFTVQFSVHLVEHAALQLLEIEQSNEIE